MRYEGWGAEAGALGRRQCWVVGISDVFPASTSSKHQTLAYWWEGGFSEATCPTLPPIIVRKDANGGDSSDSGGSQLDSSTLECFVLFLVVYTK